MKVEEVRFIDYDLNVSLRSKQSPCVFDEGMRFFRETLTCEYSHRKSYVSFGAKGAMPLIMTLKANVLPLLKKMSRYFSHYSVKAEMVVVALQPFTFSPNLFYSASLLCSTYPMQAKKGGGS